MANDSLSEAAERMTKSVDALKRELASIRTGRASPTLIEHLAIEYYGVPTPLNQLATIAIPEARLLVIQPWDRQTLPDIERAIMKSDLGLNPSNDGTTLRLPIPPLNEERRRELVRVARQKVEQGRIAVRNIRRDVLEQLRQMEKDKDIPEDELHRSQSQLQKLTDSHIETMEKLGNQKESEVMEV